jgi:hypothetical protein
MNNDHNNGIGASYTLQTKLGSRHISIIMDSLVTHNFGKREVWMVA